jgi:hypothetical protein
MRLSSRRRTDSRAQGRASIPAALTTPGRGTSATKPAPAVNAPATAQALNAARRMAPPLTRPPWRRVRPAAGG